MGLGGIHPIQLLIVLALVLVLFGGRGKISALMGDLAKGISSFRKGLKGDPDEPVEPVEAAPISENMQTTDHIDKS